MKTLTLLLALAAPLAVSSGELKEALEERQERLDALLENDDDKLQAREKERIADALSESAGQPLRL